MYSSHDCFLGAGTLPHSGSLHKFSVKWLFGELAGVLLLALSFTASEVALIA
jgi:hypothetical protein